MLSFDSSTNTVHLEYSKETLMKCQAKGTGINEYTKTLFRDDLYHPSARSVAVVKNVDT